MAKLDNLKRQLEKIGVSFCAEKFGANYFQNAEPLSFTGLCVTFSFPADNGKEAVVLKYLERYGFSVLMSGGFPGYHYLHIVTAAEKNALDLYHFFQAKSVAKCEEHIHIRNVEGWYSAWTDREFNEFLSGIMAIHGEEYNEAKKEREVA